jgi:hypothetical protein
MDIDTARGLLTLTQQARERRRRQDPAAERLVEERYDEVRAAMDWCLEAGPAEMAHGMATALVTFWIATKRADDADTWFDGVLSEPSTTGLTRARALYDHGYTVFFAGRYALAEQRFQDSLALATTAGDVSLQALALAGVARVAVNTDPRQAVRFLREALSVTTGLDTADEGRSSALHVQGVALQLAGDLTRWCPRARRRCRGHWPARRSSCSSRRDRDRASPR